MNDTPATPTTPNRLHTKRPHPEAQSLYIDMIDTINQIIDRGEYDLEIQARALRDMLSHDLPRAIRQIERDTDKAVLDDIQRMANEIHHERERVTNIERRFQQAALRNRLPRRMRKVVHQ